MKPNKKSIQFGKAYYQQTFITTKTGESVLRGELSPEYQRAILENPETNQDYNANAFLRTAMELKDNLQKSWELKIALQGLAISQEDEEEYYIEIPLEKHLSTHYATVDLDTFADLIAGSGEYPDQYYWKALITDDKKSVGHLLFHNQQVTIFSETPLAVSGKNHRIQDLFINTREKVLLNRSLAVENQISLFCSTLTMEAEDPHSLLLQARSGVNILCYEQCVISPKTAIKTEGFCHIKAGNFTHQGNIEALQFAHIIAESAEIYGTISAKGNEVRIISCLGIHTHEESHLHAGKIRLIVDYARPMSLHESVQLREKFKKDIRLRGKISTNALNLSAQNIHFERGENYVAGNGFLYSEHLIKVDKAVKTFLKGRFIFSQFAGSYEGSIIEMPGLEIYWKNILIDVKSPELSAEERVRCTLPRALVHQESQTPIQAQATTLSPINILPVFPPQKKYLHTLYDKSQLVPFDGHEVVEKANVPSQLVFQAEFLSVSADIAISNATLHCYAHEELQFFSQVSHRLFFGRLDLLLQARQVKVHDALIDAPEMANLRLHAAESMEIAGAYISAHQIAVQATNLSFTAANETTLSASGPINIKSHESTKMLKGSKLILQSPLPVRLECKNLYVRGHIEFEELSIKADRLISMILADMQGKSLTMDAQYLQSFLSRFKIDKSLSVKSVVSVLMLVSISAQWYTNTSIGNISLLNLTLPSQVNASAKSILSCSLAATNTLISILQLVLQDPSSQLALSITRLGINIGPALYQAYQLGKNIQVAYEAPKLSRGDLISLANQTKTMLLTLGSLGGFSLAGLDKPFAHGGAASNWSDFSSVVSNLSSVVNPLSNMMLPGNHHDNFVDLSFFEVKAGMSTQRTFFGFQSGVVDLSLMSSYTSVFNTDFLFLDFSPTLTKTSVYSVSAAGLSPLPFARQSEQTVYKTYIGTPIPFSENNLSLSTQTLSFVGSGDFELNNSMIRAHQLTTTQAVHLETMGSSFTLSDELDNAGSIQLLSSLLTANEVKNQGLLVTAASRFTGTHLENTGAIQYTNKTEVVFKETHNDATSTTLALDSSLNQDTLISEKGAGSEIFHTSFTTTHWEEKGLYSADGHSTISAHQAIFTGEEGFLTTTANFDELSATTDVYFDLKGKHFSHNLDPSDRHPHALSRAHSHSSQKEPQAFHYADDSQLEASFTQEGVLYHSDGDIVINNNTHLVAAAPKILDASSKVRFHPSKQVTVTGSLKVHGNDVLFQGGQVLIEGSLEVKADKDLKLENGAVIAAAGPIKLSAGVQLDSKGLKTLKTQTEQHHKWFRTDKTTRTTTTYKNAEILSNDTVTLESADAMVLKGTTVAGKSIFLNAKGDIDSSPLQGADSTHRDHSNLFHVDEYNQKVETASPSQFIAQETIVFTTPGNVNNLGTELVAPQRIEFNLSENSTLVNSALILNGHVDESHQGIYLENVAGLQFPLEQSTKEFKEAKSITGKLVALADLANLPLVNNVKQLGKAKSLKAKESAGINLATEVVNLSNNFLCTTRKNGLLKGLEHAFLPDFSIGFKIGKSHSSTDYQWVGPGKMVTDSLSIHAGSAAFHNNLLIKAEHTAFDVKALQITGAKLYYHNSHQQNFVLASLSCADLLHPSWRTVGFTHTDQSNSHLYWQGKATYLGDLELNAQQAYLEGISIHIKSIKGHVDALTTDSGVDLTSQSTHHLSVNSAGGFSFSTHENSSQQAAITTPFVDEQGDVYDTSQLSIGNLVSIGSEIKTKDISFQITGSWHEMLPGYSPSQEVFTTWRVNGVTVPIYHALGGKRVEENLDYLMDKVGIARRGPLDQGLTYIIPMQQSHLAQVTPRKFIKKEQHKPFPPVSATHNLALAGLDAVLETLVPSAYAAELDEVVKLPLNDFGGLSHYSQELNPALPFDINSNVSQPDLKEESPEVDIHLFPPNSLGIMVEWVEKDLKQFESWNESFQLLVKSPDMKTYLSEAEQAWGQGPAFKEFVKTIFNPFTEVLYDRGSLFNDMIFCPESQNFLSYDILESSDVFGAVDKVVENLEDYSKNWARAMAPLRFFSTSLMVAEDAYQIANGRSPWPVIEEDIYSTLGGVIGGTIAKFWVPSTLDATISASNVLFDVLGKDSQWLMKPLSGSYGFLIPAFGIIGGSLLGNSLFEQERHNDIDISMSAIVARHLYDASSLRLRIGADFKETIPYSAETLPSNAIASYYNYLDLLTRESTLAGSALMKPIPPNIFELSQMGSIFSNQPELPEAILNSLTYKELMHYFYESEQTQFDPIYDVNGQYFRDLIQRHSDFGDMPEKMLKTSKILGAGAALNALFQLTTAADKVDEAGRLAFTWLAAEGGSSLGLIAAEAIGATNPVTLALGFAAGVAGVVMGDKVWDNLKEPAEDAFITENFQRLPSLKTALTFFKPSEFLDTRPGTNGTTLSGELSKNMRGKSGY